MTKAEQNSWRTAITRKKFSLPFLYLVEHRFIDLLNDDILDYGCGKGYDAITGMLRKYDPHFFPKMPKGQFDVVICSYVLNVLPKEKEAEVIRDIKKKLKKGGRAYITVRRNLKKDGYTSTGTYQRLVYLNLAKIYEDSDLCIYRTTKNL